MRQRRSIVRAIRPAASRTEHRTGDRLSTPADGRTGIVRTARNVDVAAEVAPSLARHASTASAVACRARSAVATHGRRSASRHRYFPQGLEGAAHPLRTASGSSTGASSPPNHRNRKSARAPLRRLAFERTRALRPTRILRRASEARAFARIEIVRPARGSGDRLSALAMISGEGASVHLQHPLNAVDLRIRDVGREPDTSRRNAPRPRGLDDVVS